MPILKYSQPTASIYKTAVAWTLSARRDARVLYLACYSSSRAAERVRLSAHTTSGLPSWVPDLHFLSHLERPAFRNPIETADRRAQIYSASCSAALIYDRPSDDSICLKGVFCATIDHIGSEAQPPLGHDHNSESSIMPLCNIVSTWRVECRDFYQLHPDAEGSIEKFVRGTLYVACKPPGMNVLDDELYEHLKMCATMALNPLIDLGDMKPTLVKMFRLYSARTANRTLLISKQGPLGTGVGQFQLGDQAFAIAGLDDLLVLRKLGDYYVLIGHAYMDGLMNGEAWPENEADLQDVEIR